jgi:hypothetical protein
MPIDGFALSALGEGVHQSAGMREAKGARWQQAIV